MSPTPAGIPIETESTASSPPPLGLAALVSDEKAKATEQATCGFRKLMRAYFETTRYQNDSGAMVPLYDPHATDAKVNIKWSTLMALPVGAT